MPVAILGPLLEQSRLCEPILRSLPQWFGIEAAIQHYLAEIDSLPTFLASLPLPFREGDRGEVGRGVKGEVMEAASEEASGGPAENIAGFLTVKQHNPYSAELLVLGVHPEFHRQGIGSLLLQAAERFLLQEGTEYLQVKTLGPSHPDESYARTRAFYLASGFRPLEEFPQIWNEANPCLIMIKRLEIQ
jgi:ribosomal protein S18 acetylase RimI-like enzyme